MKDKGRLRDVQLVKKGGADRRRRVASKVRGAVTGSKRETNQTYIAIIIGTHRVISLCGQQHHTRKKKQKKNTNTQEEVVQFKTERNQISEFNMTMNATDSKRDYRGVTQDVIRFDICSPPAILGCNQRTNVFLHG